LTRVLIINVPVVYMGWDVWIWMGEIHNKGRLKWVGPEIETFLGPEINNAQNRVILVMAIALSATYLSHSGACIS
jgi:hypothetical protein